MRRAILTLQIAGQDVRGEARVCDCVTCDVGCGERGPEGHTKLTRGAHFLRAAAVIDQHHESCSKRYQYST